MAKNQIADGDYILLVVIADRGERSKKAVDCLYGQGLYSSFAMLGKGTAGSEILGLLGLGDTKKDIVLTTLRASTAVNVFKKLVDECRLNEPGRGIAFTVPLDRVLYGMGLMKMEDWMTKGSESGVENMFEYDLLLAATNVGFSDTVMSVAKSIRPCGGTIVKGRETGIKDGEKFLGVSIQPEKELVLIIIPKEATSAIMEAIMKKAGPDSKAATFVVSIPIQNVAGLSSALTN